jgi:hypothetical protein
MSKQAMRSEKTAELNCNEDFQFAWDVELGEQVERLDAK